MSKVIVKIEGGIVQAVYADTELEVTVGRNKPGKNEL